MKSNLIIENIKKTIQNNNLINKNDKIVVGVSGGPDSMCMLHVLIMLKNDLDFDAKKTITTAIHWRIIEK